MEDLKIELISRKLKSVYGGQDFEVAYSVEHKKNGHKNSYEIIATLRETDLLIFELDLYSSGVEITNKKNDFNEVLTNEETLTDKGIIGLLIDNRGF